MSTRLEELKNIGTDIDGAMGRLLDNEEFYFECLNIFIEDEGFEALGKALHDSDYKQAFFNAHTLKGVASNLGLDPLFQALDDIVEPLRCDPPASADYSALFETVLAEKQRLSTVLLQSS